MIPKAQTSISVTKGILLSLLSTMLVVFPGAEEPAAANVALGNSACDLTTSAPKVYMVSSPLDLWEIAECVSAGGGGNTFELQNSIDVTGELVAPTSSPIGSGSPTVIAFSGTLDGKNHSISGLNMVLASPFRTMGLFASLNNALVKNLTISGSFAGLNASEDLPMGAIAPIASGRVTFSHVTVTASMSGRSVIGGFIGQGNFTGGGRLDVIDSTNSSTVSINAARAGGFAAELRGPVVVSNFVNLGKIASNTSLDVGGFVGIHLTSTPGALTASQLVNRGEITVATGRVGGIAGTTQVPTTIVDSENQATVLGPSAGGFIGISENLVVIRNSVNSGAVPTASFNKGGLIGQSQRAVEITDSVNQAPISGTEWVGGLIGVALPTSPISITRALNSGNVNATLDSVGGFVGQVRGSVVVVTDSSNSGTVTGAANTGGMLGLSSGSPITIGGSANSGGVSGTSNVGGLVGLSSGSPVTIAESANSGALTGATRVGGFVGFASRASSLVSVSQSVNRGAISGLQDVGGLIGLTVGNTSISRTLNQGVITATTGYSGGFIGFSNATVELRESGNSAAVSGNNYVGGFVGFFFNDPGRFLIAVDSLNTGAVTANGNSGGFVGDSTQPHQFLRSYQAGTVTATNQGASSDALYLDTGGGSPSTITSVYTNQTPSQWLSSTTTENMRLASTFVGWDFDTVWGFIDCTTNNGFPVLRFAHPGETFRTDGCTAVVVSAATDSATTSSDVATTSSEVVEADRGPIIFTGPLILAFDKRELATDTPTQVRVFGSRLNLITNIVIDGKEIEFVKVGTRELQFEVPGLPAGVHRVFMDTTRFGKMVIFRAFNVK